MNQDNPVLADVAPAIISKIIVSDLYYTYSYNLATAETPGPENGRLMLLYGNNGTGKTTILNLLYHLLDPKPYGGHRSFVGRIPFSLFHIQLADGQAVKAFRKGNPKPGEYTVQIFDANGKKRISWIWIPDKTNKKGKDDTPYLRFCECLASFDLKFHYLQDTRRVEGKESHHPPFAGRRIHHTDEGVFLMQEEEDDDDKILSPDLQLKQSIGDAIEWFRQQALSGTNIGYTSVNSIYRDLIKRIVTVGHSEDTVVNGTIQRFKQELSKLRMRTKEFARFGLTPDLEIDDIIYSLDSAKRENVGILKAVLDPYLEGQRARLDALQDVQRVMANLISLLGDFYSHKQAAIHMREGLDIRADNGQDLAPSLLSSGEKQLLLLFCNAVSARQDKTVLMIDEPEISLNVKWQRQLIPALLTCMAGTRFQIILATHSVELLARYREYVTPLDNLGEELSDE